MFASLFLEIDSLWDFSRPSRTSLEPHRGDPKPSPAVRPALPAWVAHHALRFSDPERAETADDFDRMLTLPLRCLALALLALSLFAASGADTVVRLCADQWMPYNGDPTDPKPGYVIELAKAVFEPKGIKVEYTVMPWTEALAAVREGRMTGAIGANKEEGAGLTLPAETIGVISICLVTRADSKWTYDNLTSFRTAKLGVIKGYAYWPAFDSYIARATEKGSGIIAAEGETPLADLMKQLLAGDLDVIAESEPVLLWYLRSQAIDRNQIRVVFKGSADPIYVAFAPNDEGRSHASMLDAGVKALRASGELEKLLRRYGLRDWQ